MTFSWPPKIDLPGYRPVLRGHNKQVREAAKLIAAATKPVLYVGGGVVKAHASAELRELAELTGAPVVTTLMARGVFPDSHPQHVGMPGMHGTVSAVTALQQSDLLITLGARFDDRVTGILKSFAPNAKVIHADIDPAEISKNRTADVPIVGSVKEIIPELTEAVRRQFEADRNPGPDNLVGLPEQPQGDLPAGLDRTGGRTDRPAARHRTHRRAHRSRRHLRRRRRPAPDVGGAVHQVRAPARLAELRRRRNHGLRRFRQPWAPRSANRTAWSGPSTATAASR